MKEPNGTLLCLDIIIGVNLIDNRVDQARHMRWDPWFATEQHGSVHWMHTMEPFVYSARYEQIRVLIVSKNKTQCALSHVFRNGNVSSFGHFQPRLLNNRGEELRDLLAANGGVLRSIATSAITRMVEGSGRRSHMCAKAGYTFAIHAFVMIDDIERIDDKTLKAEDEEWKKDVAQKAEEEDEDDEAKAEELKTEDQGDESDATSRDPPFVDEPSEDEVDDRKPAAKVKTLQVLTSSSEESVSDDDDTASPSPKKSRPKKRPAEGEGFKLGAAKKKEEERKSGVYLKAGMRASVKAAARDSTKKPKVTKEIKAAPKAKKANTDEPRRSGRRTRAATGSSPAKIVRLVEEDSNATVEEALTLTLNPEDLDEEDSDCPNEGEEDRVDGDDQDGDGPDEEEEEQVDEVDQGEEKDVDSPLDLEAAPEELKPDEEAVQEETACATIEPSTRSLFTPDSRIEFDKDVHKKTLIIDKIVAMPAGDTMVRNLPADDHLIKWSAVAFVKFIILNFPFNMD